jgi:hypothetical protein
MILSSLNKCRNDIRADQTFLSSTKFIENTSNICIPK